MALKKGLKIIDIALALRNDINEPVSTDLGTNCKHPNINKWSFNKPVKFNSIVELSDSDFFSIDDGFIIPEYLHASDAFNGAMNGANEWEYVRPVGGANSQYRQPDFIDYNHSASRWFIPTFIGSNKIEIDQLFRISLSDDISWLISNFGKFSFAFNGAIPRTNHVNIGLLLRNASSSPDSSSVYYYKICDWLDYSDRLNIKLPSDTLVFGDYNILPVITTDTNYADGSLVSLSSNNPSQGKWYILPTEIMPLIVQEVGSNVLNNIDFTLNSYSISVSGSAVTVNSVLIDFSSSNSTSTDVTLTVKMMDASSGGEFTRLLTIPGGVTTPINIFNAYPSGYQYYSATGYSTVRVTISYNSAVKTQTLQVFEK